jgi:hypothetical protein
VKDGSDNSVRHRTKFNIQAGHAKQTNNPHSFQELTNHCDPISNKAQNLTTFEPSENTELFYPLQLSYNTKSFFLKKRYRKSRKDSNIGGLRKMPSTNEITDRTRKEKEKEERFKIT